MTNRKLASNSWLTTIILVNIVLFLSNNNAFTLLLPMTYLIIFETFFDTEPGILKIDL